MTGLLTLHYHDSENDTIAITCSEELLDAVEQFSHQQALRLVVGDGMTSPADPAAAVASTTSHNDNINNYQAPLGVSAHATSSLPINPTATMRPFIHGRHSCDSCGMMPIVGPRYHATNRSNLDVCQNCLLNFQGQNIHFEMAQDGMYAMSFASFFSFFWIALDTNTLLSMPTFCSLSFRRPRCFPTRGISRFSSETSTASCLGCQQH